MNKLVKFVIFVFLEMGSKGWNEEDLKAADSRRGSSGSLQPPPAHQPMSRQSMNQAYNKSTLIPGTSSTLTPIDLSSR